MTADYDIIEMDTSDPEPNEGGVPVRQQLILVGGILLLIFGSTMTSALVASMHDSEEKIPAAVPYTDTKEKTETIKSEADLEEVTIVGRAAYVWDVQNQRALYKKNEADTLPLASITKLMTALVAYELLGEDESVTISEQALKVYGNSGLLVNETFNRQSLSDLVLMSSSNDGAFALAAMAGDTLNNGGVQSFVKAMNVRAEELGLHDTTFYNPTGLDVNPSQSGGYGSARDISFLMEYIVQNNPDILASTQNAHETVTSNDGFYHEAENTNYYIDEIPGLIGSKTGYTDLAGGNLIVAYDAGLNRPIIISVLGSTQLNRFTDVIKLIETTNNYLATQ